MLCEIKETGVGRRFINPDHVVWLKADDDTTTCQMTTDLFVVDEALPLLARRLGIKINTGDPAPDVNFLARANSPSHYIP